MGFDQKAELTKKFEGVFSLLLTLFHEDGSIDWEAYERYVEWRLSFRPQGLFAHAAQRNEMADINGTVGADEKGCEAGGEHPGCGYGQS